MKKCISCGTDLQDEAVFCTKCGAKVANEGTGAGAGAAAGAAGGAAGAVGGNAGAAGGNAGAAGANAGAAGGNAGQGYGPAGANQNAYYNTNQQQGQYYAPPVDIYDHTAEFDPKDIAANKVIAMVAYLLGTIGIIIALLGAHDSKYAAFHVRQALKFTVLEMLTGIIAIVLCWTFVVPIAAALCILVLFVVRIICFFSICSGKAKEAPIIRSFGFLN